MNTCINLDPVIMSAYIDSMVWLITLITNIVTPTSLGREMQYKISEIDKDFENLVLKTFGNNYVTQKLISSISDDRQYTLKYIQNVAQNGNKQRLDEIKSKWIEADMKIAGYLNSLDSYWDINKWDVILQKRIELIDSMARSLKNNDASAFSKHVSDYQKLNTEIMQYLSGGFLLHNATQ